MKEAEIIDSLRLKRRQLHLKQLYVAAKLDKYASWVSKIENHDKKLTVQELIDLCNLYDIEVKLP